MKQISEFNQLENLGFNPLLVLDESEQVMNCVDNVKTAGNKLSSAQVKSNLRSQDDVKQLPVDDKSQLRVDIAKKDQQLNFNNSKILESLEEEFGACDRRKFNRGKSQRKSYRYVFIN